jgi:hypothetical protein
VYYKPRLILQTHQWVTFALVAGIDEALSDNLPAALSRGDRSTDGTRAGVLTLYANEAPAVSNANIGLHCTR